jgi:hypothetical protein
MISDSVVFLCSAQKLPFFRGWCLFVIMWTSGVFYRHLMSGQVNWFQSNMHFILPYHTCLSFSAHQTFVELELSNLSSYPKILCFDLLCPPQKPVSWLTLHPGVLYPPKLNWTSFRSYVPSVLLLGFWSTVCNIIIMQFFWWGGVLTDFLGSWLMFHFICFWVHCQENMKKCLECSAYRICHCSVAYPNSYFWDKSSGKSLVHSLLSPAWTWWKQKFNCSYETISGGTLEWSRDTLRGVLGEWSATYTKLNGLQ